MDLDELRVKLAATLNANIDIPLIDEKWEQVFFERLIDRVWPMIPQQVKWSIGSISSVIEPAYIDAITQSVRLSILPIISGLFWWRDDHLKITDTITNHLMAMTAPESSIDSYPAPEPVVQDHANETAVGPAVAETASEPASAETATQPDDPE
jgi:hypothetical protein